MSLKTEFLDQSFNCPGGTMYVNFGLVEPNWQIVSTVPARSSKNLQTQTLVRGLLQDCRRVEDRFGCFAWLTRSVIYDCCCFGTDYKAFGFSTNLEGKLSYALGPEQDPITHENSNGLWERINRVLETEDVFLGLLRADGIQFGRVRLGHNEISLDADLAYLATGLLVYTYRQQGQCAWRH